MIEHADGIYFNLSHEAYRNDPALGSGDMKSLLLNPVQWWWKSPHAVSLRAALMSAAAVEEETLAQAFGTAVHTVTLEGRAVFDARYWVRPAPPEGVLATRDDMRAALLDATGRRPFGQLSHADLVLECRKVGPAVGLLLEDWEAGLLEERGGRTEISTRWQAIMTLIDRMLDMARPDYGGESVRQRALRDGYPEVSVFWTDHRGVRCKARIDFLRIPAMVDVKTFMAKDDEQTVEAFARSMEQYGMAVQQAHYLEGRAAMPRLIAEGAVFGEVDPKWLARLAAYSKPPAWVWLGVRTTGMPEVDVYNFTAQMIRASADIQVAQARDAYVEYRDRFGLTEPWVSMRGTIEFDDLTLEAMGRMRRLQSLGEQRYQL